MLDSIKSRLSAVAFRAANIQRIHIIGCARSGTTFFQYCMLAYSGTEVVDAETSPLYPDFGARLALCRKAYQDGGMNYVTKRPFGWFKERGISDLMTSVRLYGTGVIYVVRDPRAVMQSKHRRSSTPEAPYVDEDRWLKSMLAAETIWANLAHHERKCIVRYEDLIQNPDVVDEQLRSTFALVRHDGTQQLNQAKTNATARGYLVSEAQNAAMHGLRDADTDSLSKDLPEIRFESSAASEKYAEIMRAHYARDDR